LYYIIMKTLLDFNFEASLIRDLFEFGILVSSTSMCSSFLVEFLIKGSLYPAFSFFFTKFQGWGSGDGLRGSGCS
jgi:hypothetical protein